ncbi:MAG: hypothetical protein FD124_3485 [Alphaproteobacteria bacterium]|nr:MAG: hypothetical protein FD160_2238 [Caulobacteraceae bacterium]TPW02189.1 MAG: hypothetical protein FD124_3485 [Alphaproteobacteria bacterium]
MSKETLDLAHMTDAQFDALYKERIEPLFVEGEAVRTAAVAMFKKRMTIGAPVALGLGVLVLAIFQEGVAGLIVAAIAGAVAFTLAYMPLQRLSERMKTGSLTLITEAIGVTYGGDNATPPALPRFRDLDLLPGHDRSHFEDFFHGERQGCAFDLCEAKLEDESRTKNGKTYVTVFRGQMIRMAFPKKFHGVTVVKRDAGVFNGLRAFGELKRVGLGDSTFEKAFEVYSNDQVEARYLVHPVFMERLIHLEQAFNGRRIRCGFQDGDLLLAVEGDDKFEIGDMFRTLDDPARARRIVGEIAEVMKLMDAVLTAEMGPLVARRDPGAG